MSQSPELTIVIPAYNRPRALRETLDRLTTTLVPRTQVLVSDDASPNEQVLRVLDDFADRFGSIRYIRQKQNLGLHGNWQYLLNAAESEYIFLLCDDDRVPADFFDLVFRAIDEYPEADMITGDVILCDPNFKALRRHEIGGSLGPIDGFCRMRHQLRSHHMVMATIYRRSALLRVGGFDGSVGSHLDCTAYCRVALRAAQTVKVASPLLEFRISHGSVSHTLATGQQAQLARWYRRKLDLVVEDISNIFPNRLDEFSDTYAQHARSVLTYLEIEFAKKRLSASELKQRLSSVLAVFPEVRWSRMHLKIELIAKFGISWLRLLRWLLRKPSPYQADVAIFNQYESGVR